MKLRLAEPLDSEILLKFRNDPVTRSGSHHSEKIKQKEHDRWFKATLNNPNIQLYVFEIDGKVVGTARSDFDEETYKLSWTVAPEERGKGVGKKMVYLLANALKTPIRAEVKESNIASIKIAKFIGMTLDFNEDGILYFSKK